MIGRIRTVKPQFFKHEGLWDLERRSGFPMRVAFEGLWCFADREGRFEWRPRILKAEILPYDDVNFEEILAALWRAGFIIKYTAKGKTYAAIPTFLEHQRPHGKEARSRIPPPPAQAEDDDPASMAPENLPNLGWEEEPCLDNLGREDCPSITKDVSQEGNRKGREGEGPPTPQTDPPPPKSEPAVEPTGPEDFDTTPAGLANAWCWLSARKRHRRPEDDAVDMAPRFAELCKRVPAEQIRLHILDPSRNKNEYFWEFQDRLLGKKGSANGESRRAKFLEKIRGADP